MILLTLLTVSVFIKLGLWQLQRSHEKQLLIQRYQQHSHLPALTLQQIQEESLDLQFRQLVVQGSYDHTHSFLLDNRFYNHQLGYQVLTPFRIADQRKLLLVNRGWIAANKVSHLVTPTGNLSLKGYIDYPPTHSFRLSKKLNNPTAWPRIIETINLAELSQSLAQPIYPLVVKLLPTEAHGFVRDWAMVTTMPPERHQAYAFQWFALALAVLIIFLAVNTKKISHE